MSTRAQTHEERVRDAALRRLADSRAPWVRVPVAGLANDCNANSRQCLRALRRLEKAGLIEAQVKGSAGGVVVIARGEEAA